MANNRLQEIQGKLKKLDRQFFAVPERERNLPKTDKIRDEIRSLLDEAKERIGEPQLPGGFKYGHPSMYEGTVRYAVHILPAIYIPVKAWGKIIKLDEDLKTNLAKYGVEFYGEFLQKIGAPPHVKYAGRREFIVGKKGLSAKFDKWYKNGSTKASKPTPAKAPTKEPWEMTREEVNKALSTKGGVYKDAEGTSWTFTGKKTEVGLTYLRKATSPGKKSVDVSMRQVLDNHEYAIKQAISQGKPVPPEVLKDYPELGKPTKIAAQMTKEEYFAARKEAAKKAGLEFPEEPTKRAAIRDVTPAGFGPGVESGSVVSPEIQKRKGETLDQAIAREVGYQIDNGRVKITEDRDGWKATAWAVDDDKPHIIRAYSKQQVLNEVWRYLNPNYVTPEAKPEVKPKYTPVEKLPDADLLQLYLKPIERDMPQDMKDYLRAAEAEFDKRKIKLTSPISAKPSNYPEIEAKPLPQEGSIISRGNLVPIAYEIGGKKYKTSAVLAPTRGKSMELHYDIYFGHFKVGTGDEITKAHIDKGIALAKAFTLPDAPAKPKSEKAEVALAGRDKFLQEQVLTQNRVLIDEEIKKAGNREVGMKVAADRLEKQVDPRTGVVNPENAKAAKLIREAAVLKVTTPKAVPRPKKEARLSKMKGEVKAELLRRAKAGEKLPVGVQGTEQSISRHVEGMSGDWLRDWHSTIFAKGKATPKVTTGEAQALIVKTQDRRSARAIAIDNALLAKEVVPLGRVLTWAKKPNRYDIRGIDTPTSRGKRKPTRKPHRGVHSIVVGNSRR